MTFVTDPLISIRSLLMIADQAVLSYLSGWQDSHCSMLVKFLNVSPNHSVTNFCDKHVGMKGPQTLDTHAAAFLY